MRILSKLILARERQPLAQSTWAVTSPSPQKRPHLKLPNLTYVPGVPKGMKRIFWVREKREGRARNEEGERFPLLASPSHAVSLLNSHSLPFRTFATYARDNQVILSSYSLSQLIDINFIRCDFNPRNLSRF